MDDDVDTEPGRTPAGRRRHARRTMIRTSAIAGGALLGDAGRAEPRQRRSVRLVPRVAASRRLLLQREDRDDRPGGVPRRARLRDRAPAPHRAFGQVGDAAGSDRGRLRRSARTANPRAGDSSRGPRSPRSAAPRSRATPACVRPRTRRGSFVDAHVRRQRPRPRIVFRHEGSQDLLHPGDRLRVATLRPVRAARQHGPRHQTLPLISCHCCGNESPGHRRRGIHRLEPRASRWATGTTCACSTICAAATARTSRAASSSSSATWPTRPSCDRRWTASRSCSIRPRAVRSSDRSSIRCAPTPRTCTARWPFSTRRAWPARGRVVSASSSSVYGGAGQMPTPESAPLIPRSPYAVSKLAGEHYCRVYSELHGLETVSLRYFNIYGPRQRPDSAYAAVIPLFIEALANGRRPTVHGDGGQSRDFTFIDDAVAANIAAATAPASAQRQGVQRRRRSPVLAARSAGDPGPDPGRRRRTRVHRPARRRRAPQRSRHQRRGERSRVPPVGRLRVRAADDRRLVQPAWGCLTQSDARLTVGDHGRDRPQVHGRGGTAA